VATRVAISLHGDPVDIVEKQRDDWLTEPEQSQA